MEIKGNARRILKFLSEQQENKSFYPTRLYNKNYIDVQSRKELDNEIATLYNNNLINKEGENIIITDIGTKFILQIESEENKEIYKDIFSNFKLALLKYFYARSEPLEVGELPIAFEQNVEKHYQPNGSDSYNLIHFIEIENKKYFNTTGHKYELNENGTKYLYHLLTEAEKKRTPIFSTINIHQQKGDKIRIQGDGNTVFQNSSSHEPQINPAVGKVVNRTINPRKNSWVEKAAWIVGIAAGLVAIYEFIIKRFV